MYYTNPSNNNTNDWQHTQSQASAYQSNWQDQTNRNQAQRVGDSWFPGWESVDAQDDGGNYKVHMRDGQGHFRTIVIDAHFRALRSMDGYC